MLGMGQVGANSPVGSDRAPARFDPSAMCALNQLSLKRVQNPARRSVTTALTELQVVNLVGICSSYFFCVAGASAQLLDSGQG